MFGVRVSASEGLEEETIIRINNGEQRVEVDRSSSSLSPFSNHSTLIAPLCFPFNNNNISRIVDLRIIVDHSLLEIFVNYCSVITTFVFILRLPSFLSLLLLLLLLSLLLTEKCF